MCLHTHTQTHKYMYIMCERKRVWIYKCVYIDTHKHTHTQSQYQDFYELNFVQLKATFKEHQRQRNWKTPIHTSRKKRVLERELERWHIE